MPDDPAFKNAKDLSTIVEMWGDHTSKVQFCGSSKMLLRDLIKETEDKCKDSQISVDSLRKFVTTFLQNEGVYTKQERNTTKKDKVHKKAKPNTIDRSSEEKSIKRSVGEGEAEAADSPTTKATTEVNQKQQQSPMEQGKKLSSMFLQEINDNSENEMLIDDDSAETYQEVSTTPITTAEPIKSSNEFFGALEEIALMFPEDSATQLMIKPRACSSAELVVLVGKMTQLQSLFNSRILSAAVYCTEFKKLVSELVLMQVRLFDRKFVVPTTTEGDSDSDSSQQQHHNVPGCISLIYCSYIMMIRAEVYKNTKDLISFPRLFATHEFHLMGGVKSPDYCAKLMSLVMADIEFYEDLKKLFFSDSIVFRDTWGSKFSLNNVEDAIDTLKGAIDLLKNCNELGTVPSNCILGNNMSNKCMIFCHRSSQESLPVMFFRYLKEKNIFSLISTSTDANKGEMYFTYSQVRNILGNPIDNAFSLFGGGGYDQFLHVELEGYQSELIHFEKAFDFVCNQIHKLLRRVDMNKFTEKLGPQSTTSKLNQSDPQQEEKRLKGNKQLRKIKERFEETLRKILTIQQEANVNNGGDDSGGADKTTKEISQLGKEMQEIVQSLCEEHNN